MDCREPLLIPGGLGLWKPWWHRSDSIPALDLEGITQDWCSEVELFRLVKLELKPKRLKLLHQASLADWLPVSQRFILDISIACFFYYGGLFFSCHRQLRCSTHPRRTWVDPLLSHAPETDCCCGRGEVKIKDVKTGLDRALLGCLYLFLRWTTWSVSQHQSIWAYKIPKAWKLHHLVLKCEVFANVEDNAVAGQLVRCGRRWRSFSDVENRQKRVGFKYPQVALLQITYLSHLVYDFELRDGTGRSFPYFFFFCDYQHVMRGQNKFWTSNFGEKKNKWNLTGLMTDGS